MKGTLIHTACVQQGGLAAGVRALLSGPVAQPGAPWVGEWVGIAEDNP